jgi:predicted nucleotidyltransferase
MQALSSRSRTARIPSEEEFLSALDATLVVMREVGVPYLFIGAIGSAAWGRDRGTKDIDLFVRPEHVETVLDAFDRHGFLTEIRHDHWLCKAHRNDVTVDVIFRASRDILLDDEMLQRATIQEFRGRTIPVTPPEDLVVMKAIAAGEDTARYWHDALGIISRTQLDWDYFERRARQHGAKRLLSLLLFAASLDLVVPVQPMTRLADAVGLGGVDER